MDNENKLNVAYKKPTALEQLGAFTGELLKEEMKGNVTQDRDTLLKLTLAAFTRIAFDGKTEKLYQTIKTNFPEYFTK